MVEDKNKKTPSELRFDIVSKDWVVIATGRAKRPEMFKEEQERTREDKNKGCPFCNIGKKDKPILVFIKGKKQKNIRELPKSWSLVVIPNKYPAVVPGGKLRERAEGPYQIMDGVGFHEVVITRDHHKDMTQFSSEEIKEVIDAYQERYLELMNEPNVNYISVFHNNGKKAGASISHPHSQIMAIPVVDPDLEKSLTGSYRYFNFHKKCIHCEMIKWDRQDGRRVVFENDDFIALCPFASRMAFSVRIYPKEHLSYFERVNEQQKRVWPKFFKLYY